MKKLRLLITDKCNRDCKLCCNKNFDLQNLPICDDFKGYSEIMITGGEPALFPFTVTTICKKIRIENPEAKIIIYTADVNYAYKLLTGSEDFDGLTLTIHKIIDAHYFDKKFRDFSFKVDNISLRLNSFVSKSNYSLTLKNTLEELDWKFVKFKWLKDCPLPIDEEFKRI